MMKTLRKKTWVAMMVVIACAPFPNHTLANPVSWQQAQQNVQSFLQQRGRAVVAPLLRHVATGSADACWYVFNIGDDDGYVIASGDDGVPPILGYANEGSVDVDNMPENMRWWLDEYTCQIQFMRSEGNSVLRTPRKSSAQPAISPLLTTRWNQTPPYNNACPLDTNGLRCVTGCVATAMAQVLYYHHARSVNSTTHDIPAYITERGVSVDGVPAGSFIDWDNMVEAYGSNVETTPEQDEAVANLMKYCGTSVQMDYTSGSSGAMTSKVASAMVAYFNYTSKTESWDRSASGLSDDEWEDLIYHELSFSRPVLYSGFTKFGTGHAFVCDGYDGEGFFHFNWGWGSSGSYYLLSAIDSVGTSLIHYNISQEAIINAEPRLIEPSLADGIQFADPVARAVSLQSADENDDGVLTAEEAESITSMGPFRQAWMSSFDEFRYFTGVTSLCFGMFSGCEVMESIILHDGVTTISENAFNGCSSLKEISIPCSVASVGKNAFLGCKNMKRFYWNVRSCLPAIGGIVPTAVEHLVIGDSVQVIPSSFARETRIKNLTFGKSVTKIATYAFYQCTGLKKVVIPDAVASINQWAFYGDSALEDLTLGKGLTIVGDRAFGMCSSLKSVTIPNSVTKIGMYAFYKCTELKSVVIGNSVATISGNAFNGCESLMTVTCLRPEPISINTNVFNCLYEQATLRVPAHAVDAYKAASPWNQFSEIIGIDPTDGDVNLDGVTNINDVIDLIDQLLSNSFTEYGDVNGDGRVNIADLTAIIDKILSGKKP